MIEQEGLLDNLKLSSTNVKRPKDIRADTYRVDKQDIDALCDIKAPMSIRGYFTVATCAFPYEEHV